MAIRKPCITCGLPVVHAAQCGCQVPRAGLDDEYKTNRRILLATTPRICHICGEGPRQDDPWTADHLIARAEGGSNALENLARAHRSCNSRRGVR